MSGSVIDVGGGVSKLSVAGDVDAQITVDGYLSKMQIKGGDLLTDMYVGGGIGKLDVKSSKYGGGNVQSGSPLVVDGAVSKLKVRGDLEGSDITVAGLLSKMDVYGDYVDSSVLAWQLGKVKVKGDIRSTDATDDVIQALTGSFYLYEGKTKYEILDAAGQWLDGVHAFVG